MYIKGGSRGGSMGSGPSPPPFGSGPPPPFSIGPPPCLCIYTKTVQHILYD